MSSTKYINTWVHNARADSSYALMIKGLIGRKGQRSGGNFGLTGKLELGTRTDE
jgi:hypothetical protein